MTEKNQDDCRGYESSSLVLTISWKLILRCYYPLINITVSCTYHQNKEMKAWGGRWREDQTYSCTIAVQCRCGITQITPGHSQYKNTLRSCDQSGGECPVIKVQ